MQISKAYKLLTQVIEAYAQEEGIKFVTSPDAPSQFEEMKNFFTRNGYFLVYDGGDHGFLGKEANTLFRAVHDYTHCLYGYDFSFEGETSLSAKTIEIFDKVAKGLGISKKGRKAIAKIIHIEIKLQLDHYYKTGDFVEDQGQFVLDNW
jgi:hypothetical protein